MATATATDSYHDDILTNCSSITEDELTALEAIYPDCITRRSTEVGILIKMILEIDLGGPRHVTLIDDGTTGSTSSTYSEASQPKIHSVEDLTLSHLPPLIIDLRLPPDYPLLSPPTILSAYFTHSWLSPSLLSTLLQSFHSMWMDQRDLGEGVLWRITETIVTASFLDTPLKMASPSDSRIRLPHAAPLILRSQLTSYNASVDDASFAITAFRCAICFEDRKGSACRRLACEHVFCKDCLRDTWALAVREGDCKSVRCPDPECVAKTSQRAKRETIQSQALVNSGDAAEEDVRSILSEEEVKRWKWLKAKRDIERDPTIVHCPLQFCQSPVPAPKSAEPVNEEDLSEYGIGWQKLRSCEACGFSFCIFCKKAWHGPITPCDSRTGSSFVREYLGLPEGSPRRVLMERTLGKANLAKLIQRYEEDEQNREWLENSTTKCPGCGVFCEKSHGCNHMTCVRCLIHYCYRCGERIDAQDPYKHFSTKGNRCYNKLFDFEETTEEPAAWDWAAILDD